MTMEIEVIEGDPLSVIERLGFIPSFLSDNDKRSAKEQIDANYSHGGGWRPLSGWKMNPKTKEIKYPGDPSLRPIAKTKIHRDEVLFYDHAWVAIVSPDGSYEIARLD